MYNKKTIAGLEVVEIPGDREGATILLLHGYGSHAMDLYSLNEVYQDAPKPTWIFPNGPLDIPFTPDYTGKAWFPVDLELLQRHPDQLTTAFPREIDDARKTIEQLINALDIPLSKLMIGGFSQGAILSVEVALNQKEPLAALLIFSGTLINESNWKIKAPKQARTPFFQSHGKNDALLPWKKAKELTALLLQAGLQGKCHTFSGGHEIPLPILTQLHSFLHTNLNRPR